MDFRIYIQSILRGKNFLSKLILINVAVFLVLHVFFFIISLSPQSSWIKAETLNWLYLPSSFESFIYKPWTLFSYFFVNLNLLQIIFGLLYLFTMGNIFQDFVGAKKLSIVYLFSGIISGLVFLGVSALLPADMAADLSLSGFNLCLLGLLAATATLVPDYEIQLFILGRVRLKWLALFFIAIDLIFYASYFLQIFVAHAAAITFGFAYVYNMKNRTFLGDGFDAIYNYFKGVRFFKTKTKKTVQSKTNVYSAAGYYEEEEDPSQEDIDAILDKISQTGYKSLNEKEKHILFKASKQS